MVQRDMFSYPLSDALPHKAEVSAALLLPPVSKPLRKQALEPFFYRHFSMALRPGPWHQAWVQYFLLFGLISLVLASSHPVIHPKNLEVSAS